MFVKVFFAVYVWGKILRKKRFVYSILENIRDVLLISLYLSLICSLGFKFFILGIKLVMKGIPINLVFNICYMEHLFEGFQ